MKLKSTFDTFMHRHDDPVQRRLITPPSAPQPEKPLAHVHLQWFAAEDEGRTEEPTEQRIRRAREEGKVARSNELNMAIGLLLTAIALGLLGSFIFSSLLGMIRHFFSLNLTAPIAGERNIYSTFINFFMRTALPIMLVGFVAAAAANLMQVGFLFSVKPIQPDFNKVAPNVARWMQRSFLSAEAWFNLGKTLFKAVTTALISYLIIRAEIGNLQMIITGSVAGALELIAISVFKMIIITALVMLIFAIVDYVFQRRQYLESLKMTRHELKEEFKQSEGDPQIRSHIRRRMRELVNNNMMKNVPQADVVITNPTHFAVALQWQRQTMRSPMVTAKGADEVAQRIKRIAAEHGVPLMENKPLARALYDNVEVGDEIPERYWEVVSRILAEVYRMKGVV